MNTPTHTLINWTVAKGLNVRPFPKSAVLLGSVAPDIPLYLLSFGGIAWFRWAEGHSMPDIGRHMYSNLFYNDAYWISLHNVLHSPLVLIVALVTLFFVLGKQSFVAAWSTWFFASCLLHTLVDIPVHYDDGPLLFWPLNWTNRYRSPISYWDPDHYGRIVMYLEGLLVLALMVPLLLRRRAGLTED